ncbi:MAG: HYR domain-containing protein, partial [Chthoniobacteraceae bacterium]
PFLCSRSGAVVFSETANPAFNTAEPAGALQGSGWQYQASFGDFLGTPIGPHFFLTAKHVGLAAGQVNFRGTAYTIVAGFEDPNGGDLKIWQVAQAFPEYAPLYTRSDETGRPLVVFGRGRERGVENYLGGVLKGWEWGGEAQNTHIRRWGQNVVAATRANPFGPGDVLYATFDLGMPNEAHISAGDSGGAVFVQDAGVWKLAGINYATEDMYRRNGPGSFTLLDRVNLFDARGYYSGPSDGALIAGATAVPNGFYATRISSRLTWIYSIIGGNTAPAVTVAAPVNNAVLTTAHLPVTLAASAADAEDGSITGSIAWSSSINGPIGTGGTISVASLAVGTHTITAAVTDSGGLSGSASITITVLNPGSGVPVTNGLVLHLDSTQGVSLGSGSAVTGWSDSSPQPSGSRNDVTAFNGPQVGGIYLTPTGFPAVHLDGENDRLERTGMLHGFPGGNANRTIFLVAKYNSSTWWAGIAYGNAANNESFGLNVERQAVGNKLVLHGYGGGNDLLSATQGIGAGWLVQSALVNNGTATHFKDGVQIGQWAHNYNTGLAKFVIGAEIGNLGYAGMDVAAVLLYDRALSASERAEVEAYLRTKFLVDTMPPLVAVPANIATEATESGGAVVEFNTSALDVVSGVIAPTNAPAPGSIFPLGTTAVTATAVDVAGNSSSRTFAVTVRDTTAPAGGAMTVAPAVSGNPGVPMSVSFPGWTDLLAPLSYQVLVDDVAMNTPGTATTVTFTGPTAAGAHTVKGRISDTEGNVTEVTQSFAVHTPIESWRQTFFGTPGNTGAAADGEDPYHTGIPNLLVFAFFGPGQNPSEASVGQLPQLQMEGGDLFFSFDQPAGVSGVTYGAEWNTSLMGEWLPIPDTGSGVNHLFSVPIGSHTGMFIRLRVTRPESQ